MAVQWLRLRLQMRRVRVPSLVEELRFPRASWPTNQNTKRKQKHKKFNKVFKNGPYPKKSLKTVTEQVDQTEKEKEKEFKISEPRVLLCKEKEKYGIPHKWDLKEAGEVNLQNRDRLTDLASKHMSVCAGVRT